MARLARDDRFPIAGIVVPLNKLGRHTRVPKMLQRSFNCIGGICPSTRIFVHLSVAEPELDFFVSWTLAVGIARAETCVAGFTEVHQPAHVPIDEREKKAAI